MVTFLQRMMINMGLFTGIKDKRIATSRLNDKEGRSWQRLDSVSTEETREKRDYLKVRKTIVKVLEGEDSNPVGSEPSHAMFPDKYGYFFVDVKKLIRAGLGVTTEEVNALTETEVQGILDEKLLDGRTVEVLVTSKEGKDGKNYPVINYLRQVSKGEIADHLSKDEIKRFWPEGL